MPRLRASTYAELQRILLDLKRNEDRLMRELNAARAEKAAVEAQLIAAERVQ